MSQTTIGSGTIVPSLTISSGTLTVDSGGTVEALILQGSLEIDGGLVTDATINGMISLNSGTLDFALISNGTDTEQAGATLENALLLDGAVWTNSGTDLNITLTSVGSDEYLYGFSQGATITEAGGQVLEGGTADSALVIADGFQQVNSGAAFYSTIAAQGVQEVLTGLATATAALVLSGGEQYVEGGTALDTTIASGGNQNVEGGLAVAAIVQSGGNQNVFFGTASLTLLLSGATQQVQGGSAVFTTIASGGIQYVTNGAVSDTTVQSGGEQILSGGASYTTVEEGGLVVVSNGGSLGIGTLTSGMVAAGGIVLDEGGVVSGVTLAAGALMVLEGGGQAYNTDVEAGGLLIVNGGTAIATTGTVLDQPGLIATRSSGQSGFQLGGSIITGLSLQGGTAIIASGGTVLDSTLNSDEILVLSGGTIGNALIQSGSVIVSGGGTYTGGALTDSGLIGDFGTISDVSVSNGGLILAISGGAIYGGVDGAGGKIGIFSGTDTGTTITSGGVLGIAGGTVAQDIVGQGGLLALLAFEKGGSVADSVTVQSGGALAVFQYGAASNTVLQDGAGEAVFSGGTAYGTTLETGAVLVALPGADVTGTVLDGGTAVTQGVALYVPGSNVTLASTITGATLDAGGIIAVLSGGKVVDDVLSTGYPLVLPGGLLSAVPVIEIVVSGGTATGTRLSDGAEQIVSGGTSYDLYVGSGGEANLTAGSYIGAVVASGGVLSADGGGLVEGVTVLAGGYATVSDSNFTGTTGQEGPGTLDNALIEGGSLVVNSYITIDGTISFSGTGGTLDIISEPTLTIAGFTAGDVIYLEGYSGTTIAAQQGDTITIDNSDYSVNSIVLDMIRDAAGSFSLQPNEATGYGVDLTFEPAAPCFCAGTRIATPNGETAVETLRIGDEVRALLGVARILWIGRRTLAPRRHRRPEAVQPILITAGALGGGLPWRDLMVSPDHGLYLEGHLIPAKALTNGFSIRQVDYETVTYYHLEFPEHDVVFAEGTPAESYLETGNRAAFDNCEGALTLHPDFAQSLRERSGCAPFAEAGKAVEVVRQRILDCAGIETTCDPGLQIRYENGGAIIASRSAVPGEIFADPRDRRLLGVKISSLTIGRRKIPLDNPALDHGWHEPEADGRWTNGNAFIPAALLGTAKSVRVRIAASLAYPVVNGPGMRKNVR